MADTPSRRTGALLFAPSALIGVAAIATALLLRARPATVTPRTVRAAVPADEVC